MSFQNIAQGSVSALPYSGTTNYPDRGVSDISNGYDSESYIFGQVPPSPQYGLWTWSAEYPDFSSFTLSQLNTLGMYHFAMSFPGKASCGVTCNYPYDYQVNTKVLQLFNANVPIPTLPSVGGSNSLTTGGDFYPGYVEASPDSGWFGGTNGFANGWCAAALYFDVGIPGVGCPYERIASDGHLVSDGTDRGSNLNVYEYCEATGEGFTFACPDTNSADTFSQYYFVVWNSEWWCFLALDIYCPYNGGYVPSAGGSMEYVNTTALPYLLYNISMPATYSLINTQEMFLNLSFDLYSMHNFVAPNDYMGRIPLYTDSGFLASNTVITSGTWPSQGSYFVDLGLFSGALTSSTAQDASLLQGGTNTFLSSLTQNPQGVPGNLPSTLGGYVQYQIQNPVYISSAPDDYVYVLTSTSTGSIFSYGTSTYLYTLRFIPTGYYNLSSNWPGSITEQSPDLSTKSSYFTTWNSIWTHYWTNTWQQQSQDLYVVAAQVLSSTTGCESVRIAYWTFNWGCTTTNPNWLDAYSSGNFIPYAIASDYASDLFIVGADAAATSNQFILAELPSNTQLSPAANVVSPPQGVSAGLGFAVSPSGQYVYTTDPGGTIDFYQTPSDFVGTGETFSYAGSLPLSFSNSSYYFNIAQYLQDGGPFGNSVVETAYKYAPECPTNPSTTTQRATPPIQMGTSPTQKGTPPVQMGTLPTQKGYSCSSPTPYVMCLDTGQPPNGGVCKYSCCAYPYVVDGACATESQYEAYEAQASYTSALGSCDSSSNHHPIAIEDLQGVLYVLDDWEFTVNNMQSSILLLRAFQNGTTEIPVDGTHFPSEVAVNSGESAISQGTGAPSYGWKPYGWPLAATIGTGTGFISYCAADCNETPSSPSPDIAGAAYPPIGPLLNPGITGPFSSIQATPSGVSSFSMDFNGTFYLLGTGQSVEYSGSPPTLTIECGKGGGSCSTRSISEYTELTTFKLVLANYTQTTLGAYSPSACYISSKTYDDSAQNGDSSCTYVPSLGGMQPPILGVPSSFTYAEDEGSPKQFLSLQSVIASTQPYGAPTNCGSQTCKDAANQESSTGAVAYGSNPNPPASYSNLGSYGASSAPTSLPPTYINSVISGDILLPYCAQFWLQQTWTLNPPFPSSTSAAVPSSCTCPNLNPNTDFKSVPGVSWPSSWSGTVGPITSTVSVCSTAAAPLKSNYMNETIEGGGTYLQSIPNQEYYNGNLSDAGSIGLPYLNYNIFTSRIFGEAYTNVTINPFDYGYYTASQTTTATSSATPVATGEAPQLSSTYAQYDNGANVFEFYDDFAGTVLDTNKWVETLNGGFLSVDDGLMMLVPGGGGCYGSCNFAFIESTTSYSPSIAEMYVTSADEHPENDAYALWWDSANPPLDSSITGYRFENFGNLYSCGACFRMLSSTNEALAGWWPLNGNANDYSSNGNTGSPVDVTYSTVGGVQVANLDGTSSYISTGTTGIPASPLTISAWVYPTSLSSHAINGGTGSGGTIIEGNTNGGSNGYILGISSSSWASQKLWWWPSSNNDRYSTGSVPLNTWTFVTMTYDGTNLDMYLNGVLDSSQPAPPPQAMTFMKIGAPSWTTGYFQGQIANIQVYGTAISASQVASLYAEGIGGAPVSTGVSVSKTIGTVSSGGVYSGILGGTWSATGSEQLSLNYVPQINAADSSAVWGSGYYLALTQEEGAGSFSTQWVRIRSYAPNGVMPTVSVGPVQRNPSTVSGGAPPLPGIPGISPPTGPSGAGAPTAPQDIVYYAPITLTNTQTSPFPANAQIRLDLNTVPYILYEAGNLDNVEFFYADGTVIPSWLEGSVSNPSLNNAYGSEYIATSTDTLYWLRIASSDSFLCAQCSNTIYIGFASPTTNLMGTAVTTSTNKYASSPWVINAVQNYNYQLITMNAVSSLGSYDAYTFQTASPLPATTGSLAFITSDPANIITPSTCTLSSSGSCSTTITYPDAPSVAPEVSATYYGPLNNPTITVSCSSYTAGSPVSCTATAESPTTGVNTCGQSCPGYYYFANTLNIFSTNSAISYSGTAQNGFVSLLSVYEQASQLDSMILDQTSNPGVLGYNRLIYTFEDSFDNRIYAPLDTDFAFPVQIALAPIVTINALNSNETSIDMMGTATYTTLTGGTAPLANNDIYLYYDLNLNYYDTAHTPASDPTDYYGDSLLCAFAPSSQACQLANPLYTTLQPPPVGTQESDTPSFNPDYNTIDNPECHFQPSSLLASEVPVYNCNIFNNGNPAVRLNSKNGFYQYCLPLDFAGDGVFTSQLGLVQKVTTDSNGDFRYKFNVCGNGNEQVIVRYYGFPPPQPVSMTQTLIPQSAGSDEFTPSATTYPVDEFTYTYAPDLVTYGVTIGSFALSFGDLDVAAILALTVVLVVVAWWRTRRS
jgi:hypothetical protein